VGGGDGVFVNGGSSVVGSGQANLGELRRWAALRVRDQPGACRQDSGPYERPFALPDSGSSFMRNSRRQCPRGQIRRWVVIRTSEL